MKKLIFGFMSMFLSGCAIHNTGFECRASKGQSCTSVSRVNRMIDLGLIKDDEGTSPKKTKPAPVKFKPKPIKQKNDVDVWIVGNDREEEKFI